MSCKGNPFTMHTALLGKWELKTCVGMHTNDTAKIYIHGWNPLQTEPVDYDYLLIQSSVKKGPGQ